MAVSGKELDANIAILDAFLPKGVALTDKDIAEICDCSQQSINYTWLSAKKKLSQHPVLKKIFEEIK